MKFTVSKETTLKELEKYLSPVEKFGEEKIRKGAYDDWNEMEHTKHWLSNVLESINLNGTDKLNVYYLEEDNMIIGVAFALYDSQILLEALKKDGVVPGDERIAQVTCFHVVEQYRSCGRGSAWLENEILSDLRDSGIQTVYIRSSHHRALNLYEKLGENVGNYITVSDHELYQRYGYIYKLIL